MTKAENLTSTPMSDEGTLLRLAASVEQLSTHILSRAVVEAAQERSLPLSSADDFEEVFGKGVRGRVPLIARRPARGLAGARAMT